MSLSRLTILCAIVLSALPVLHLKASSPLDSKPFLQFEMEPVQLGEPILLFDKGKKKKRRRRGRRRKPSPHVLGAGVVLGGATGLGGRVVLKPGIVALAFDASANRVKTEDGVRVWTSMMKLDGRLYGRGLLDQLVHPYLFAGLALQRGKFEDEVASTAYLGDLGLGAELKFGRIGVNGEVGLMVPLKSAINFRPGLDFYGGVAIMLWLF